jgi:hypothetical protein
MSPRPGDDLVPIFGSALIEENLDVLPGGIEQPAWLKPSGEASQGDTTFLDRVREVASALLIEVVHADQSRGL